MNISTTIVRDELDTFLQEELIHLSAGIWNFTGRIRYIPQVDLSVKMLFEIEYEALVKKKSYLWDLVITSKIKKLKRWQPEEKFIMNLDDECVTLNCKKAESDAATSSL